MRLQVERFVTKPLLSPPPGALRPSELTVLRMLAQGRTNAQIAALTGLSRHTVKDYVASIYVKLGVRRRAEAVIVALRRDLLKERP